MSKSIPAAMSEFDRVVKYPDPTIDGFYVAKFGDAFQFVLNVSDFHRSSIVDMMMRDSKKGKEDEEIFLETQADFLLRVQARTMVTLTGLETQGIPLVYLKGNISGYVPCDAYLTPSSIGMYERWGENLVVNHKFSTNDKASVQHFMAQLHSLTSPADWIEFESDGRTIYLNAKQDMSTIDVTGNDLSIDFKNPKAGLPEKITFAVKNAEELKILIEEKITTPVQQPLFGEPPLPDQNPL